MSLTIIAAMTPLRVIADSQKPGMLWHIPDELAHFRKVTLGKACIVGRKTALAMPLLSDRIIYVLSKSGDMSGIPKRYAFISNDEMLQILLAIDEEIMVIGGKEIYEHFMPYANKAIISIVTSDVTGDIYMPNFVGHWKEVHADHLFNDDFFVTYYERICK